MPLLIALMLVLLSHAAQAAPGYRFFSDCRLANGDETQWSSPDFDDSQWLVEDWSEQQFEGILWLRCPVRVDEGWFLDERPVGLYLGGTFSAEVWWDGVPIGSKGVVAATADDEIPGPNSRALFVAPRLLASGEHTVAFRISAEHASKRINTPIDALYVGPFGDPLEPVRRQYRPAIWTVGALLLACAFLMVMGLRTGDRASLVLALATLGILAQLGLETSRAFFNYSYDWHATRLLAVSVSAALAGIFLVTYLCMRFKASRWWVAPIGLTAMIAIPTVPYPDFVTVLIVGATLACGIVVCGLAWRAGARGARVALAALLVVLLIFSMGPEDFLDTGQFLGFALLLLVFFADHINAFVRARQERTEALINASRLELEVLKQQVRPHFLMNTLTSLSEWIDTSPKTGVAMIDALSAEFRYLNEIADRKLIRIEDEIDLCRQHLRVMGFRQDLRFELIVDGPPEGFWLPPAILHTLIENALTHGDYRTHTVFELRARIQHQQVHVSLSCPPGQTPARVPDHEGTGLSYVKARLNESFRADWQLHYGPTDAGGWKTELRFPEHREDPDR